ncbi:hypothetical protein CCAX7_61410 [Capsulimonas corticalis]|uniref:Uncharacterized protein n=1 Tax=Capsulimonas corticalis TaxID=2219043 RepID=A0A402CW72_9BACT|nr:alpha/beta fold hydrolase [Capsulimonas corticalis]BDI34090.1 hypothetical protein CCAX7_61410 [Capsulimonas corticalis]
MTSVTAKHKANGVFLSVREQGRGDALALVFLHYYGGSGRTWDLVASSLADEFRCIAPDLRGWGDSEAPTSGYTVDDMADDIEALAAVMKIGSYVLVGHSMGGKAAQALASRRPLGLRALVLITPSPPTPEPMTATGRTRLAQSYGDRDAARETLREITALPLTPALADQVIEDNLRCSRAAWMAWLEIGSWRRYLRTRVVDRISHAGCRRRRRSCHAQGHA